jgi:hypothetical protein
VAAASGKILKILYASAIKRCHYGPEPFSCLITRHKDVVLIKIVVYFDLVRYLG